MIASRLGFGWSGLWTAVSMAALKVYVARSWYCLLTLPPLKEVMSLGTPLIPPYVTADANPSSTGRVVETEHVEPQEPSEKYVIWLTPVCGLAIHSSACFALSSPSREDTPCCCRYDT